MAGGFSSRSVCTCTYLRHDLRAHGTLATHDTHAWRVAPFAFAFKPGFAQVFSFALPDAELARLVALENRVGAGPFRAETPVIALVSNATWLAELLLPLGLLVSRTRPAAIVGSLLLMLAIQAGAREIFFAGLMVGGLLLFAQRDRVSPFVPIASTVYVAWLAAPMISHWLARGAGA